MFLLFAYYDKHLHSMMHTIMHIIMHIMMRIVMPVMPMIMPIIMHMIMQIIIPIIIVYQFRDIMHINAYYDNTNTMHIIKKIFYIMRIICIIISIMILDAITLP